MATKAQEMQRIIRQYKTETGISDIDMKDVAKFALSMGWPMPKPQDPIDLLAKQLSESARAEIRVDKKSKRPYRGQLSYNIQSGEKQQTLWLDTDEAPRFKMQLAINRYREQIIGEALMGTNTVDHWNRSNPDLMALEFDSDFRDDVLWRLNGQDHEEAA